MRRIKTFIKPPCKWIKRSYDIMLKYTYQLLAQFMFFYTEMIIKAGLSPPAYIYSVKPSLASWKR